MSWEVRHLGVHSQQVIEIAKSLSFQADVLIMDEPSAALPENEVQRMFDVVKRLRDQGVAIVYVSHRMKEILKSLIRSQCCGTEPKLIRETSMRLRNKA